jgi:hypothetical protein
VNARAERRMELSIVDGVDEREVRRFKERRPRVPDCLARKPACILCFEERAG